jgi:hypothetical protein
MNNTQDTKVVIWGGGKRILYRSFCKECGKDRGYKCPSKKDSLCNSCGPKKAKGILGLVKACITCGSTEVKNPNKCWHAGPTCNRCYSKRYRNNNKDEVRSSIDEWRAKNKQKHQQNEREYKQRNKDKIDAQNKAWREANIEHCRKVGSAYRKNREATVPTFRIANRLRARFYKAMRFVDSKSLKIISKYIDYSMDDLKKHLESLFQPGMTWENYGVKGWHVDHERPLCSFDLTQKDEIIKAWKLSNLRPLWAKDNWQKSKQDKLCKKK